MNKPVDKDSLQLNQPKRTPGHPTKSHIVKTKVDGKEKIIRFGQQGASTAGKPKEGESERMTAKRDSFKARHSANIAKGPSSAAYWANKVKWADGGSVRTNYAEGDSVQATPQQPVLGSIANFLKKSYSPERTQQMQGMAEFFDIPALARTVERMSYGEPITNVGKANVPMLPDDTAAAAMLVGPAVGPLGRVAKKVGKAGAKVVGEELNRAILDNSGALAKFVPEAAKPMYAVKPKGGNWLAGSIEEAVGPLKTGILNETGLRNLGDRAGADVAENVRIRQEPSIALNKWIDQKIGNYIKNDMGTPKDPVRALAERNILHVDPAHLNYDLSYYGKYKRPGQQLLAKSDAAKLWEGTSDNVLSSTPAGNWSKFSGDTNYAKSLEENPWLSKVPPETPVYQIAQDEYIDDLGFRHLIDELTNAIDPESTLPANLRLTPKQLNDVTMPQAVERVSKINDWRDAEAAKAEKAGMLENLTATPRLQDPTTQLSFVEKPGMTWVDIPATTDEKANKLCTTIGKQAGWCTQGEGLAKSYGSGDNRLTTLLDADGRPHAQALISKAKSIDQAYNDVIRGNVDITDLPEIFTPVQQKSFNKFLESDDFDGEFKTALDWIEETFPEAHTKLLSRNKDVPADIRELKPVGNAFSSARAREYEKRDPQYQAKITDSVVKFLNSGEWGKVNDLDKYDIADLQNPKSVQNMLSDILHYDLSSERAAKFNEAIDLNPDSNRFMSRSQFKEFVDPNSGKKGFAQGGSMSAYDPMQIDEIMNSIDAPRGYDEGGKVDVPDMDFKEDPETLRLYKHAMKQFMPNQEDTISTVSTGVQGRVGSGDLSAGIDMNRMTKGQQDQLMRSIAANYNVDLGGLNLNARLEAPLDAKDVFVGMLNGSIPIGEGRAMLGVQGIKTPYGSDVLGYNAGYSDKVGPGKLNVNVNKPKRGKPSAQVQYQIPFAEGGSVIKNAATDFMKFLDDQGLSMSDVVAAFGKRGMPLSAAFYSGDLNVDEDLELRKRRKQKPTIDEPKFAQGGSVSVYDPDKIDEIINGLDDPQGYAEGGTVRMGKGGDVEDTLDTFVAPRYRKQRATPSSKETKAKVAEAAQFAADMVIPQSAFDVGLMLIPGGKVARKAGAALIALDAGDAEAGGLSALRKFKELINREAPEQANKIREALRLTKQTGREHSVIGLANEGGESVITRGTESAVLPNSFDLRTAKRAPGSPTIVDFHTHPGQGTIFETAPSRQDFQFYSSEYPSKAGRDLRTLVAVPPTKDGARRTTSYNFFETRDPAKVFDPNTLDSARYELQRAGKKGSFKSIQDDPAMREYFDYGGDLASLLEDATPLALMRYRAGQGLGRHELQLGGAQLAPSPGAQLAPSPGATDIELFRQLERPAVELLKSKKFAEGGSVSVYDPDQVDAIANQFM